MLLEMVTCSERTVGRKSHQDLGIRNRRHASMNFILKSIFYLHVQTPTHLFDSLIILTTLTGKYY